MKRVRRAFTIVELLMVVAILAVLMTIVGTTATSAVRSARSKRASAMRVALQAAIATYQATDPQGKWPAPIETASESGETTVLSPSESQRVFRIIVQKSTGESGSPLPLIDPHGLYVAPTGATDGRSEGRSYDDARRGDSRHRKMGVGDLVFGYQGAKTGKFRSFHVVYHAQTDSVTVSGCCERCLNGTTGACDDNGCRHCHGAEQ